VVAALVAALVGARMNGRHRIHRDGLYASIAAVAVCAFVLGVLVGRVM
jgi:hypothetical protein